MCKKHIPLGSDNLRLINGYSLIMSNKNNGRKGIKEKKKNKLVSLLKNGNSYFLFVFLWCGCNPPFVALDNPRIEKWRKPHFKAKKWPTCTWRCMPSFLSKHMKQIVGVSSFHWWTMKQWWIYFITMNSVRLWHLTLTQSCAWMHGQRS